MSADCQAHDPETIVVRKRRAGRGAWCKGREGIPHTWEWVDEDAVPNNNHGFSRRGWKREQQVCFGCGKQRFRYRVLCRACGHEPPGYVWMAPANCGACGKAMR